MTDRPTHPSARRTWVRATALIALIASAAVVATAGVASARSVIGPYFAAPFKITKLRSAFGHGASWATNGDVLSSQYDRGGILQIYRSKPGGQNQRCLTCATVPGPNGLPQERPEGDWILFESYGHQPVHVGNPGLGGYGGDLYLMRPDGSHPFRLTTNSDPNRGARFGKQSGVPYDNFHAYWSPDGRHIIWTHAEARPLSAGGQSWEILLGTFVVIHGRPALENVRVVGRPYGVYETQPWSPDGKGFLFCAAGGYRSPYQAAPPGWGNMRLYYMRLYGRGASPAHPRVTLVSDNAPLYEEQAVFTPDMKTVIMMSNRGDPVGSWYDLVAAAAQRTRFYAPDTGSTQTLQFLADFDGPDFRSDLYAVDVRTGAIRRLTNLHGVIPEFYWNDNYTRLIWGMGQISTGVTYTARFAGIGGSDRRIPRTTPGPLYGQPVAMSRVGTQAQAVRDPGPTDNVAIAVAPPPHPAPGFPHASSNSDQSTIPVATGTYVEPWLTDLKTLGSDAGVAFTTDPLTRLGLGS